MKVSLRALNVLCHHHFRVSDTHHTLSRATTVQIKFMINNLDLSRNFVCARITYIISLIWQWKFGTSDVNGRTDSELSHTLTPIYPFDVLH